jgi:transposase
MENNDARKTPSSLYERRKQVLRLHKKGYGNMAIAAMTELSWPTVKKAVESYKKDGINAIKPKKRGRKMGSQRSLSKEQEIQIQKIIIEKRPEQLKMIFALWTRGAVLELIESKFGIKLSIRGVGKYLKRWGFTPQKPIKRAYEQQPEKVKQWLNEVYPEIEAKAKVDNAEIHWADETSVVNTDVRGRSYSPRGKTPETLAVWGHRESFSMLSSVTNQGKCRWMIIDKAFDSQKLIEFMESLIKDSKRRVFIIMDNLRVHHSKLVKSWLSENSKNIEAFYLPSYSPELNPDERLNADLKERIGKEVPVRTRPRLLEKVKEHMKRIESTPERVKNYFGDPHVNYAAEKNEESK